MQALDEILEAAQSNGYEAGKAAGSWVVDGNTSRETAVRLLAGIEDGDPRILDEFPSSPLSGEWADSPLSRDVLAELGLSELGDAADDVLTAYELGFATGVEDEVCRSAKAIL